MSWFIAKNVSESWNVNWNLMLSRLKGNSQIFRYNVLCFFSHARTEQCSSFALSFKRELHARGTCALASKARNMDWVAGYFGKGADSIKKCVHFNEAQPRIAYVLLCRMKYTRARESNTDFSLFHLFFSHMQQINGKLEPFQWPVVHLPRSLFFFSVSGKWKTFSDTHKAQNYVRLHIFNLKSRPISIVISFSRVHLVFWVDCFSLSISAMMNA